MAWHGMAYSCGSDPIGSDRIARLRRADRHIGYARVAPSEALRINSARPDATGRPFGSLTGTAVHFPLTRSVQLSPRLSPCHEIWERQKSKQQHSTAPGADSVDVPGMVERTRSPQSRDDEPLVPVPRRKWEPRLQVSIGRPKW